jgi:hypothetical protein
MDQARFVEVDADVRYWEDARINGEADTEGKIPLRKGDAWQPIIELATGRVLNWPAGIEANIHYKVCDGGEYWLLDAEHKRIAKLASYYVPDILCVGEYGYGDYIILKISGEGVVIGWEEPHLDADEWGAAI